MTEIELNEQIERIERSLTDQPAARRQTGRQFRREMTVRKNDRLMRIITTRYLPHAGYINGGFDGHSLLHSGKYIQYPKSSDTQRWLKRQTGKRMRRCGEVFPKGNMYRRLFRILVDALLSP